MSPPASRPPPPLLQVHGLSRRYALPRRHVFAARRWLQAVDGVDFTLHAGRSLGVVGESGSGKSTLARLVMALEPASAGRVLFDGQDLHALPREALRRVRRGLQMVFQDPYGSLDPRRRVADSVAEPLRALHAAVPAEVRQRVVAALEAVGLRAEDAARYPHEFSGGQRQRIAIARALVTRPRLIVADEPVSALDVSVQAQVLNLMQALQRSHGLSYLFISHDLAVVERLCDEVLVMQDGRVVERGPTAEVFARPQHPCTRRLIAALPALAAESAASVSASAPMPATAFTPGSAPDPAGGGRAPGGPHP